MSISTSAASVFRQFCAEGRIRFQQIDQSFYMVNFGGRHAKWSVFCHMEGTLLYFLSVLPLKVPKEKQPDVLDYLNRINWEMAVGNFEMDPSEGDVQLRTSLDCAGVALTPRVVTALLCRNLISCNHYLPGLLYILFAHMSSLEALQVIEIAEDGEEPDADELNELLSDLDLDQLSDNDDE